MNTWKELAFSGEGKIFTTALYVLEFIFGTNDVLVSEIGATFPKRHTEFRHSAQHSNTYFGLRADYRPASAFVAVHLQVRSA